MKVYDSNKAVLTWMLNSDFIEKDVPFEILPGESLEKLGYDEMDKINNARIGLEKGRVVRIKRWENYSPPEITKVTMPTLEDSRWFE